MPGGVIDSPPETLSAAGFWIIGPADLRPQINQGEPGAGRRG